MFIQDLVLQVKLGFQTLPSILLLNIQLVSLFPLSQSVVLGSFNEKT